MYIGIDAGASWIKANLYNEALGVEKSVRRPSGAKLGVTDYFANIIAAIHELNAPEAKIGLAVPAQISPDGTYIEYMVNVKGLEAGQGGISLQEALSTEVSHTQYIAHNDAGCAALGEWAKGRGQGDPAARLLHLTWGTGIGTGFVCSGQSQYGWEGGHIPLAWEAAHEEVCGCGSAIDLESFIAVPLLLKKTERLVRAGTYETAVTLADLAADAKPTETLLAKAQAGDALAHAVIDEALTWMARGLHVMAVTAQPTIVTIGGGMMADDWLLDLLRTKVSTEGHGLLATTLPADRVFRAQLGNDAGMLGAAVLAQSLK